MFTVYGLIDPTNQQVFYVGQTKNLKQRIRSHMACDPGCLSYFKVCEFRDKGLRFQFCVFAEYETRHEALRLERSLARSLPHVINVKGLLQDQLHPHTEDDDRILEASTNPMPDALAYESLLGVRGFVKPMIHKDWARDYPHLLQINTTRNNQGEWVR